MILTTLIITFLNALSSEVAYFSSKNDKICWPYATLAAGWDTQCPDWGTYITPDPIHGGLIGKNGEVKGAVLEGDGRR